MVSMSNIRQPITCCICGTRITMCLSSVHGASQTIFPHPALALNILAPIMVLPENTNQMNVFLPLKHSAKRMLSTKGPVMHLACAPLVSLIQSPLEICLHGQKSGSNIRSKQLKCDRSVTKYHRKRSITKTMGSSLDYSVLNQRMAHATLHA